MIMPRISSFLSPDHFSKESHEEYKKVFQANLRLQLDNIDGRPFEEHWAQSDERED
jgi:hypothetical protein